jgi:hypothetical protein
LMEDALSSKMAEFMTALDQVKKYREILASMTDFTTIMLGTIVAALSFTIVMRLSSLFIIAERGQNIVLYFLFFAIFPAGIIAAVWRVRQRVKSVRIREWKTTLNEGAAGALELLQDIQWDKIFSDIRYAKLGFFLYGIAKILAFWGLAVVSLFVFNWLVEFVLHMSIDYLVVMLFSLVVVLVLSRNDLRKRYDQMGRLDWLLWELRWFESEFRGADFEA